MVVLSLTAAIHPPFPPACRTLPHIHIFPLLFLPHVLSFSILVLRFVPSTLGTPACITRHYSPDTCSRYLCRVLAYARTQGACECVCVCMREREREHARGWLLGTMHKVHGGARSIGKRWPTSVDIGEKGVPAPQVLYARSFPTQSNKRFNRPAARYRIDAV